MGESLIYIHSIYNSLKLFPNTSDGFDVRPMFQDDDEQLTHVVQVWAGTKHKQEVHSERRVLFSLRFSFSLPSQEQKRAIVDSLCYGADRIMNEIAFLQVAYVHSVFVPLSQATPLRAYSNMLINKSGGIAPSYDSEQVSLTW